jgi:hypothetical protein
LRVGHVVLDHWPGPHRDPASMTASMKSLAFDSGAVLVAAQGTCQPGRAKRAGGGKRRALVDAPSPIFHRRPARNPGNAEAGNGNCPSSLHSRICGRSLSATTIRRCWHGLRCYCDQPQHRSPSVRQTGASVLLPAHCSDKTAASLCRQQRVEVPMCPQVVARRRYRISRRSQPGSRPAVMVEPDVAFHPSQPPDDWRYWLAGDRSRATCAHRLAGRLGGPGDVVTAVRRANRSLAAYRLRRTPCTYDSR